MLGGSAAAGGRDVAAAAHVAPFERVLSKEDQLKYIASAKKLAVGGRRRKLFVRHTRLLDPDEPRRHYTISVFPETTVDEIHDMIEAKEKQLLENDPFLKEVEAERAAEEEKEKEKAKAKAEGGAGGADTDAGALEELTPEQYEERRRRQQRDREERFRKGETRAGYAGRDSNGDRILIYAKRKLLRGHQMREFGLEAEAERHPKPYGGTVWIANGHLEPGLKKGAKVYPGFAKDDPVMRFRDYGGDDEHTTVKW